MTIDACVGLVISLVRMASRTCEVPAFMGEFESRVMIEHGSVPGVGGVALGAGGAKTAFVNGGLRMARYTCLRLALEGITAVARLAIDGPVFAGQLESGQIMVEAHVFQADGSGHPGAGAVALAASGAELALVDLRLGVTGDTGNQIRISHVEFRS